MKMQLLMVGVLTAAVIVAGCKRSQPGLAPGDNGAEGPTPQFSLAWSEYPSWSVFGVAEQEGIIDGQPGKLGSVERKWNVDIVLRQADYEPCMTMYGTGQVDAVCITNMDILAPSLGRASVAVLPTSTSDGADACVVTSDIQTLDDLAGKPSYGLEKSVSQYMFERNLQLQQVDVAQFPFQNMDPAAAAQAMINQQPGVQSIVVWNPFLLQTLRSRQGTHVLFDSTTIPEEIIDMLVVGKDSLAKPGGDRFACALIDAFYQVNQLLEDPQSRDATLVALGEKFSNLGVDDMGIVVQQTRFYDAPERATELFTRSEFQHDIMPRVVDFCVEHEMVDAKPQVGFGDEQAQLNFDVRYLDQYQTGP